MAWTHDTGYGPAYDHQGYGEPSFDPGSAVVRDENDLTGVTRTHDTRVVGWHTACSCGWRSRVIHSRANYPVRDATAYLAPDALDEGPIQAEWRAHLNEVLPELAVHDALQKEATGRGPVEQAVRQAREAGASWTAVGRAAGITRQSAHERWAHLEDADTDAPAYRKDSSALQTHHALAAAVDGLEERGPVATATRADEGWAIRITDADDLLDTVEMVSSEWKPNAAGHLLIEAGWIVSSPAHFVRGRVAGWAHRGETWTAPVVRDDA